MRLGLRCKQVVEEDEAMEKELPASIERTKALKLNTEHLKIQIKIEDDAHIDTIQTWAQNLAIHKQVLTHLHTQTYLFHDSIPINICCNLFNIKIAFLNACLENRHQCIFQKTCQHVCVSRNSKRCESNKGSHTSTSEFAHACSLFVYIF